MTIQEAVDRAVRDDAWIRPVAWRGTGAALEVSGIYVRHVPFLHGHEPVYYQVCVADVLGEWETVTPDVVHAEGGNNENL